MRVLVIVLALCGATVAASADEPYERTRKLFQACVGVQGRAILSLGRRIGAADANAFFEKKCGQLELQSEKEFVDFLLQKIESKISLNDKEAVGEMLRLQMDETMIFPYGVERAKFANSIADITKSFPDKPK